ncbi:hypothetical protein KsCSTR_35770 [Candidatus Kuenenia stuttgartiensis]|uniref:Uncharacterized protein n=1 Tax=Kuenenia stuttgartiensis TaxID=174633 RepID=A0A2C9CKI1_KUEST|nr:hypothetical protein KsCSTR_25890 [Candidatus Kuenenia stuttgartiensis]QII12428.1 hypothetical protein KsCSTR_30490 [Candidatus Kuenenia stuttgartiensis]QII12537.1 hypothetical protein KsCSTR_31580 [Candidatus Kuenenia stuttgartiensis]QII12833.1 hypothetical protein KsCSTR_34540 [Candidatus Kuenenia stuttgartiensis]QII12956.1 hypothetical protein KsCSTR_35770 [Candidatus Kuenenia stuttgartiensis]
MPKNSVIFRLGAEQLNRLIEGGFSLFAFILSVVNGKHLAKNRRVGVGLPDEVKGVAECVFQ